MRAIYEFAGRQGTCTYWWRVMRSGLRIYYYCIDGGTMGPVSCGATKMGPPPR